MGALATSCESYTRSVETMMHLTCKKMPVWKIEHALDTIKSNGIQNVLALGDPHRAQVRGGFPCAIDLVEHTRAKYGDYFGITVAGHPEAHADVIQSNGKATLEGCQNGLTYLKRKVDAGSDLIIAPLFYNTDVFIKFVDDCRQIGITCPIIPGITPMSNYASFMHISYITKLSKTRTLDLNPFDDAIFYEGRFYAISIGVKLVVCDLGPVPSAKEILSGPSQLGCWVKYLVNAGDTLFLVAMYRTIRHRHGKHGTERFKVYILLPDSGGGVKRKLVKNLRSLALFVGGNSSICLCADDYPECKRNCIYFRDDYHDAHRIFISGAGSDMGVYNYGDGTLEPLYPGVSQSRLWPPVWVKPN